MTRLSAGEYLLKTISNRKYRAMPNNPDYSIEKLVRRNEELTIKLECAETEIAKLKVAYAETQAALTTTLTVAHEGALKRYRQHSQRCMRGL